MTARIREYLQRERPPTPCLVVDLDEVEANYRALADALPLARIYYAVKANPAAPILKRLIPLGANFDAASIYEIEPLGVAFPRHEDDLAGIVSLASSYNVPILPRGSRMPRRESADQAEMLAIRPSRTGSRACAERTCPAGGGAPGRISRGAPAAP